MPASPTPALLARSWATAALRVEDGLPPGDLTPLLPHLETAVEGIDRQRVVELVLGSADALDLPGAVRELLSPTRDAVRRLMLVRLAETRRLDEALSTAGIPWMLIKGSALAVQTTGDVSARGCGDIDVLVAPSSVAAAHRVLVAAGWVPHLTQSVVPGSWAWEHVLTTFHEATYAAPSSSVDLHWRLDPTRGTLPEFDELLAASAVVDLAGTRVRTLCPEHALEHACYHAAKDDWRWLRSLVDVYRLARMEPDWSRLPLTPPVLGTLAVTRACLGLPAGVPAGLLADLDRVSPRLVRRARRAQDRPGMSVYPRWGAQAVRGTRYRLTAGTGVTAWSGAVSALALPVTALAGVDDARATTAVPRALARRGVHLYQRARGR